MPIDPFSFMAGVMLATCAWFALVTVFVILRPWMRCFLCGLPVPLMSILGMRLRSSPVNLLCDAAIALVQSGRPTTIQEVETLYLKNKGRILTMADIVSILRDQPAEPRTKLL